MAGTEIRRYFKERGRVRSSPMTSTATPVSAATEQEHQHNDNQEQFHGISPLTATALFAAYPSIQRTHQWVVPEKRATRQLALWCVSNFVQPSLKFKRVIRRPRAGTEAPLSRLDRMG